jgi:protein-disulfide isomerase
MVRERSVRALAPLLLEVPVSARRVVRVLCPLLASLVVGADPSPAAPAVCGDEPVAFVGEAAIPRSRLTELSRERLLRLHTEAYEIERRLLEDHIDQQLLRQEAERRGLSVAALEESEIRGKVGRASGDEVKQAYEAAGARHPDMSGSEVLQLVVTSLHGSRLRARRRAFLDELRAAAGVRILLEPERATLTSQDAPSRGPADAPVTIVEFCDFQCPYCAGATVLLDRLLERFPDDVRVVFRHFPLSSHKQAAAAAEAAACAHEQGAFWKMHDKIFAHQRRLARDDLVGYAQELALDTGEFEACLSSRRHSHAWQQDVAEASRFGVAGTPTFFVNGRLLTGGASFETLTKVVAEELEWARSRRALTD